MLPILKCHKPIEIIDFLISLKKMIDENWAKIQKFAKETLLDCRGKHLQYQRNAGRVLEPRFSYTKFVSKDEYDDHPKDLLRDGATPILMYDDSGITMNDDDDDENDELPEHGNTKKCEYCSN